MQTSGSDTRPDCVDNPMTSPFAVLTATPLLGVIHYLWPSLYGRPVFFFGVAVALGCLWGAIPTPSSRISAAAARPKFHIPPPPVTPERPTNGNGNNTVFTPVVVPAVDGSASVPVTSTEDDEPYTIKCICDFVDDDGSTVYCERCDTWQHIVCYYDNQEVPEIHNCVDCEPRFLDAKAASERQRRWREQQVGDAERKPKRSAARSSKKKQSKDKDKDKQQVVESAAASAAAPPAKRPKITHRASASKDSLQQAHRKRSSISIPSIPYYSPEFMHLYENDHGSDTAETNLLQTIQLTSDLMLWAQDPSAAPLDSNGRSARESFTYPQRLNYSTWPGLTLRNKIDSSVEIGGKHPTWKILTVDQDVLKDEVVGEIRGKVGLLRDYSLDPANRWQELRHPVPFVFFHPQLPIYIDSREQGTRLRFARRSCQPNVTLKTYILNQSEYHFCFVANQDIPANSEITATWYLDPVLLNPPGVVKAEGSSNELVPEAAAIAMSRVLSVFGGCACNSSHCMVAKLDWRRRPRKSETASTSALTATTSRAKSGSRRSKARSKSSIQSETAAKKQAAQQSQLPQEAQMKQPSQQHRQDNEEEDTVSTAGSTRHQSRSRDFTPAARGPSVDATSPEELFPDGMSAREKRKLAAVEKKFEELEQQPKRRRKDRASTSEPRQRSHSPSKASRSAATKQPPNLGTSDNRRASASSSKTVSPKSAAPPAKQPKGKEPEQTPSSKPRRQYADLGIQADLDAEERAVHAARWARATAGAQRVRYVPPARARFDHLMGIYKRDREHFEALRAQEQREEEAGRRTEQQNGNASITAVIAGDAQPTSLPPPPSGTGAVATPPGAVAPPSPLLPSTAAHTMRVVNGQASAPRPAPLDAPGVATAVATASPDGGATHSSNGIKETRPQDEAAQSAAAPAAPPAKKKLTLGDYITRRGTLTTTSGPAAKASAGTPQSGDGNPVDASAPPGTSAALDSAVERGAAKTTSQESSHLPRREGSPAKPPT
ncbi:hypothetical protein KEM52_004011 [Ascosphaera acerosa]|nr:hypothetical protein KEM52_004011 [Ascosphaera acerosa]